MFDYLEKTLNGQTMPLLPREGVSGSIVEATIEDIRNNFKGGTFPEVVIYLDNGWRRILSQRNKTTLIRGLQTDDLDVWEGAEVCVFQRQTNRKARCRELGVAPDDLEAYDPRTDGGAKFETEVEVLAVRAREK